MYASASTRTSSTPSFTVTVPWTGGGADASGASSSRSPGGRAGTSASDCDSDTRYSAFLNM